MITVYATREGLAGKPTATGYVIEDKMPFVALPSTAALRQWVRLKSGIYTCVALVLDIGPWNVEDHAYVFQAATLFTKSAGYIRVAELEGTQTRPQAETGRDMQGRRTNKAGIDLSEAVWKALSMKDNSMVSWEFL